ncbi:MAG: aminotransferase class III-fold pyridoxal phosphate-dependent enzyme [Thermoleophilia bacterium]|nr:aminotransferase class III-fold pyridoxal phosphate-dependent enzyme [Thermoleophilia bacterium]
MAGPRVSPQVSELDTAYVLPTYARQPLEIVAGEGSELIGRDGVRYLDFVTGLSVSNFGHCHPLVVEAVRDQVGALDPLLQPVLHRASGPVGGPALATGERRAGLLR